MNAFFCLGSTAYACSMIPFCDWWMGRCGPAFLYGSRRVAKPELPPTQLLLLSSHNFYAVNFTVRTQKQPTTTHCLLQINILTRKSGKLQISSSYNLFQYLVSRKSPSNGLVVIVRAICKIWRFSKSPCTFLAPFLKVSGSPVLSLTAAKQFQLPPII